MTSCPCLARAARLGALLLALGVIAGAGFVLAQDRPPVGAKRPGAPDQPKPAAGKSGLTSFSGGPGRNMVNLTDTGIPDRPDPKDETV